ncbi:MAG TPA: hypothetical protein VMC62_12335 [Longilinea sp.]|nr:hypothetical protein [Longilinea sp.]
MTPRNFPWYLVTGLLIGLTVGLVIAWVVAPVQYMDTAPSQLDTASKDQYRLMIAMAYAADGDLDRASARLALLGDADAVDQLAAQAQRNDAAGGAADESNALSLLSSALLRGAVAAATAAVSSTQVALVPDVTPNAGQTQAALTASPTPAPTATPLMTFTPRPTPLPEPTAGAPFALKSQQQDCDPDKSLLLQVEVQDAAGHPVPGVRIDVAWDGGTDYFFTGLFPEIDDGYADFTLQPQVNYSLRAGEGGETINNISAPQCTDKTGTNYWGGLELVISQP